MVGARSSTYGLRKHSGSSLYLRLLKQIFQRQELYLFVQDLPYRNCHISIENRLDGAHRISSVNTISCCVTCSDELNLPLLQRSFLSQRCSAILRLIFVKLQHSRFSNLIANPMLNGAAFVNFLIYIVKLPSLS